MLAKMRYFLRAAGEGIPRLARAAQRTSERNRGILLLAFSLHHVSMVAVCYESSDASDGDASDGVLLDAW
jgi:hypothetical protein